jgi:hypothetical protein
LGFTGPDSDPNASRPSGSETNLAAVADAAPGDDPHSRETRMTATGFDPFLLIGAQGGTSTGVGAARVDTVRVPCGPRSLSRIGILISLNAVSAITKSADLMRHRRGSYQFDRGAIS